MRTVQEVVEEALARICGSEVGVTVAGRTDAGVHAVGQVASHPGDPVPAHALNGVLPPDVRIVASDRAAHGFDARRDARSRSYCYRLFSGVALSPFERRRSLHWPYPLDRSALDRCAELVRGTHDFTAFTPTETHHVRFERDVLRAEWHERGPERLEFPPEIAATPTELEQLRRVGPFDGTFGDHRSWRPNRRELDRPYGGHISIGIKRCPFRQMSGIG